MFAKSESATVLPYKIHPATVEMYQQDKLQDKILQNVEAILGLEEQKQQDVAKHQWILESIATAFGKPWFLYAELMFFGSWWLISRAVKSHFVDWDIPLFSFREQGIDVVSLIISTGVLIYQTRQEQVSDSRAHLMLQLNMITEQKIAKLIGLVEELRSDLPNVYDRLDPEAEAMQETTNPQVILDILQISMQQPLEVESGS